ncbi:hypothetical protein L6164_031221 [Bauhinia variegata]|uniref:Uncharacterized protein n=1 Tax=Bauhinia variegata TaxID=167791 RepID=A0ACB9LEZ9_BAUVA|nr:hypothetical protein L6164_031221 [Bauhinia variegata]
MVGNIILWREVPCNLKYESSWWIEFEFGSELELEQRGDPGAVYILGQVVKCQVTSSIPASWRINLSMIKKPTSWVAWLDFVDRITSTQQVSREAQYPWSTWNIIMAKQL